MQVVALSAASPAPESPERGERRRRERHDHVHEHDHHRDSDELKVLKSHVDAEFKARLRIDGPGGRIDLKLKIELDDDAATAGGATLQSALQGFAETLQSALKRVDAGGDTPAAGDATSRVKIQLRLSYTQFQDTTASGLQQLAQPDAATSGAVAPGVFDDLVQRFSALQQAAAGALAQPLTLGGFLQALADRFRAPAATPAPPAVPAPSPAPGPVADAPAPAPAAPVVYRMTSLRFAAEYQAVALAA